MRQLVSVCVLFVATIANAGPIADSIGAYLADEDGACGYTMFSARALPDQNYGGVCVPLLVALDQEQRRVVMLAITELTNPELLGPMIQLELQRRQPTEAYEVQIAARDKDLIVLVDGTVLRRTRRGYVGYIGYREDGILYKDGRKWKLCFIRSIHDVEIVKDVEYHYSKRQIRGKSVEDIESKPVCR